MRLSLVIALVCASTAASGKSLTVVNGCDEPARIAVGQSLASGPVGMGPNWKTTHEETVAPGSSFTVEVGDVPSTHFMVLKKTSQVLATLDQATFCGHKGAADAAGTIVNASKGLLPNGARHLYFEIIKEVLVANPDGGEPLKHRVHAPTNVLSLEDGVCTKALVPWKGFEKRDLPVQQNQVTACAPAE